MKDLTNSTTERQKVLCNHSAISKVRECLETKGILSEEECRFTKRMVSAFYEVDEQTIELYTKEYYEELSANGYTLGGGQEGDFSFLSFLNIGMLLSESKKAKELRSLILDCVIASINEKTGGGTMYIRYCDIPPCNTEYSLQDIDNKGFEYILEENKDVLKRLKQVEDE